MTEAAEADANPWLGLPKSSPYVLADDLAVFRHFPAAMANFVFDGPPGPFIGNPRKAGVILLGLNPGFVESDRDAASNETIRSAWLEACRLRDDAIFHPLHPDQLRASGSDWWLRHLRAVIGVAGADAVMTGLACVEWFPYPSRRFVRIGVPLPSQDFSFELVQSALRRGSVPIIMRSRDLWLSSVPELARQNAIELHNKRNPTISPGNMDPDEWERVVAALSS